MWHSLLRSHFPVCPKLPLLPKIKTKEAWKTIHNTALKFKRGEWEWRTEGDVTLQSAVMYLHVSAAAAPVLFPQVVAGRHKNLHAEPLCAVTTCLPSKHVQYAACPWCVQWKRVKSFVDDWEGIWLQTVVLWSSTLEQKHVTSTLRKHLSLMHHPNLNHLAHRCNERETYSLVSHQQSTVIVQFHLCSHVRVKVISLSQRAILSPDLDLE